MYSTTILVHSYYQLWVPFSNTHKQVISITTHHGENTWNATNEIWIKIYVVSRDVPIMLKNLPIIPSSTSQNLYLLFFTILPIIPKLFLIIILTILADLLNLSLMIKQ